MKNSDSERGASLVEATLIIVLIALVALPSTKLVGIYAKKPMCGVMFGLDGKDVTTLDAVFNQDGNNTGACESSVGSGWGGGYYFR